jgi:hypothetical protein
MWFKETSRIGLSENTIWADLQGRTNYDIKRGMILEVRVIR